MERASSGEGGTAHVLMSWTTILGEEMWKGLAVIEERDTSAEDLTMERAGRCRRSDMWNVGMGSSLRGEGVLEIYTARKTCQLRSDLYRRGANVLGCRAIADQPRQLTISNWGKLLWERVARGGGWWVVGGVRSLGDLSVDRKVRSGEAMTPELPCSARCNL